MASVLGLLKKFKIPAVCTQKSLMPCFVPGGGGSKKFYSRIEQFQPIEKNLLTDRTVPTLFKPIQRTYFFDREIEFVSISSVKF